MSSARTTALLHGILLQEGSLSTRLLWVTGFALLTAVAAQLEIPVQPVPFTLQTLVVLLAGGLMGPVAGAASMLMYLSAGALGAPVFAGGGFGLARLIGPTGGYLLAFPVAAALSGWLVSRGRSFLWILVSLAAGTAVIFLFGVFHLNAVLLHDLPRSLDAGLLLFSFWDVLKLVAAAAIVASLRKKTELR